MFDRAAQERCWEEKYTTMELMLTQDAQQAEKERDDMLVEFSRDGELLTQSQEERKRLESSIRELALEYNELQSNNTRLEDKCAWGAELEQVLGATKATSILICGCLMLYRHQIYLKCHQSMLLHSRHTLLLRTFALSEYVISSSNHYDS